jgi:hypothetical protein
MPTGEPAGSTLNVVALPEAIKGEGGEPARHCERSEAIRQQAPLLLEQLVGSALMAGGVGHMLLDAIDFRL